ncbi:ATP-binding cassette domain-containing protein [Azotobacter vinelandii]|uniref:ATP-binding cassette domain-containing protein n=1 Tax=Azotobacter vinelandii TaxID=354 RepID=UPI002665BA73|nr:ATP-binding cassette domain-containing protein [Azotobacter vinelandii]WKN22111.1 ATP-binding cassette domain-containing protein [Azotobacter vinelandii]
MSADEILAVDARGVGKRFADPATRRQLAALDDVDVRVAHGALTALVGPDGAGKTTFLRLVAGLMRPDRGELSVLGLDVTRQPQAVQDRISYMPQRFGLYEDLSVQENLDLYADLHALPLPVRRERFARLLEMTDLERFTRRPAGKLSGGMKQKLGLACTLVRSPELLLLDEPTVGVDPLSRRELWEIVQRLVTQERLSVLLATSYMDEAERCAQVHVLHEGRVLASGSPAEIAAHARGLCHDAEPPPGQPPRLLQARLLDDDAAIVDAVPHGGRVHFILRGATGPAELGLPARTLRPVAEKLEDGFMVLLRARSGERPAEAARAMPEGSGAAAAGEDAPVIEVRDLVRRFGDFVAVDKTSFSVRRGEIFGLLGPNGAGKTTTFRMLCGLLPPSGGQARVAGLDLRSARAQARGRIGYVSQKFALYANLTVEENLRFFGGAYGLRGAALRQRMQAVLAQFDLRGHQAQPAGQLPGGVKQRLAMAVGLLHEPDILFLDEPTSGADPLARRGFWRRITALASAGTTVVVTTHFMEEAEYCDRIVIQDAGRLLALGTPEQVRRQAGETAQRRLDMEQAFIAIVERARAARDTAEPTP